MTPFISICIPAYKNEALFERLMNSIAEQSFRDFEVIITDDSRDSRLQAVLQKFNGVVNFKYIHNQASLGSPANWNLSISLARGEWIKIMHHDDWFDGENALKNLQILQRQQRQTLFFPSLTWFPKKGDIKAERLSPRILKSLTDSPLYLFRKNYIGHPSTTLIRRSVHPAYDENLKWVVDFEFYIRILKKEKFLPIPESLINIGIGSHQVTATVFRNRGVELPENIYLLNKLGPDILRNIFAYDYFWRLFRNLNIRSVDEVNEHASGQTLRPEIIKMIKLQRKFPLQLLKSGVISKPLMFLSYLQNTIYR